MAISERFWLHYAQCSGGSPRAEELGWSFWRMSMGILFTGQKTILLQGSPCLWSYRVAQKGQNEIKLKVIFFPIKSKTINIEQIIWKTSVNQFWQVWTNFVKVRLASDLIGWHKRANNWINNNWWIFFLINFQSINQVWGNLDKFWKD